MANDLTGDFDVVVEFAIGAVDRVLAAMHASGRFLHSMSAHVDDTPPPQKPRPVLLGSVDQYGDATVDHSLFQSLIPLAGLSAAAASSGVVSRLDPIVNPDFIVGNVVVLEPSHVKGRVQLQLSPPTIGVPDASGTKITARMQVMARYFPDSNTAPLVPFARGELEITAPVNLYSSKGTGVVEIDIRADQVAINFNLIWPGGSLSDQDLQGVNLLIRNALKTSLLPSNQSQLPEKITALQVKTLVGAQSAVALLLNLQPLLGSGSGSPPGHSGTVQQVLLGGVDDFAFAVGRDYVQAAFRGGPSGETFDPVAGFTLSVLNPTIEFGNGELKLLIGGHASHSKFHVPVVGDIDPSFDFTVTQKLTLNLVSTAGGRFNTAELTAVGDVELSIHGLPDWLINDWPVSSFWGAAHDLMRQKRDQALQDVNGSVRGAFDVDKNFGNFLTSLTAQPSAGTGDSVDQVGITLAYNSVEISESGITFRGSLSAGTVLGGVAGSWPAPHVDFAQIPAEGHPKGHIHTIPQGPDYSALNSWIPGGTIQQYEWTSYGHPAYVDENRFVWMQPGLVASTGVGGSLTMTGIPTTPSVGPAAASSAKPFHLATVCLRIRGTQIAASGPPVVQPVTASACLFPWSPVVNVLQPTASDGPGPSVVLTAPSQEGRIELLGHVAAAPAESGVGLQNRIVHFPDQRTASSLGFLLDALQESKRGDAATLVVAALTPDQLKLARYTPGVIYGDNEAGAWDRAFRVKSALRPLTLIVDPHGKVVWEHEGDLDRRTLAAALAKYLAKSGPGTQKLLSLNVRIGQPPPNFLFELAPGRGLTLRKLVGRAAVLLFWRSTSRPSIEAEPDLRAAIGDGGRTQALLIDINDGEDPELAKKVAAENGFTGVIVTDPERNISLAYGVTIWPTVIFLDAEGLVQSAQYGRFAGGPVATSAQGAAGASR
jgi:hypothetical protein